MAEKNCIICNRELPIIKHANQKYCDKTLRNCAKKAESQKMKLRYVPQPKQCRSCRRIVTELGMKKRCAKCVAEDKANTIKEHECNVDGCNRMVRKNTPTCSQCKKKQNIIPQYCRTCTKLIGDDQSKKARYCSDDCRDVRDSKTKPVSENDMRFLDKGSKKKDTEVYSKWTQPRGSKRRK